MPHHYYSFYYNYTCMTVYSANNLTFKMYFYATPLLSSYFINLEHFADFSVISVDLKIFPFSNKFEPNRDSFGVYWI